MIIRAIILGLVLCSSLPAADGPADSPPAAPTPTAPAAPAAKVAFGVVTFAADHRSLTMVDAKGMPLKLAVSDATSVTIDLKPGKLADVSTTATVRVTYSGDTATAIDQLKADKKKKKKTA
jgi:hypothetical protein